MRTYRNLVLGGLTPALVVALGALAGCSESPTSLQPAELRKEEIQGAPCAPDGATSENGLLTCRNGHWGSGG